MNNTDNIFDLVEDNISILTKPALPWLDMLNPEQKKAVLCTEGPLLVLSGAGTGKTKVLTTRLAYILANNLAKPWECLVVTFTNRAAREMKERVMGMIGGVADSVWLGTFHSICVKILRKHGELAGLKPNFIILNEDDQKRVIKQILEAEGIDEKKYPPQSLLDKIQRWKDKGLTADKIKGEFKENIVTGVYQKYQARLLELNCVDFGDILLHALNILLSHADILAEYQNRFKYIMVDEYQDTNVTQYLLLRLLAQKYRNLCCVGDDDQSIYSWRGAEIENILKFEKDFPDAKIIRLEQNYRSTANILAVASNLIKHNEGRLGKTLQVASNSPALKAENNKVKVVSLYDGKEEAKYVAEEIESSARRGFKYSDIAILVRTAAQTRAFEDKFMEEAIPYKVVGGLKFYERAEIKDALSYFRVILQPSDDLAFERIINKPARGIGGKSVEKLFEIAKQKHLSLYEAAQTAPLSGKAQTSLTELTENFERWRQEVEHLDTGDLASMVLEDCGYIEMLKNDKSPEAPGRLENLYALINVMSDKDAFANLIEFMEHVSLVMDADDANDPNKVQLITLHSAKGLEFDLVFLPGWEEGLFPHQRALDEGGQEALEEERRLAYVAITRAKKDLYISTALNRYIYGQLQNNQPSRFINELPTPCLELCNNASQYFYSPTPINNQKSKIQNLKSPSSPKGGVDRFSYEADYSEPENLVGAKVYHQQFGYGKITKVEGNKLGVYFFKNGWKMVMSNYVKIV